MESMQTSQTETDNAQAGQADGWNREEQRPLSSGAEKRHRHGHCHGRQGNSGGGCGRGQSGGQGRGAGHGRGGRRDA